MKTTNQRRVEALLIFLAGIFFMVLVIYFGSKLNQDDITDCWVIESNYQSLLLHESNPNSILSDRTKEHLNKNRDLIISQYEECSSKSFYK